MVCRSRYACKQRSLMFVLLTATLGCGVNDAPPTYQSTPKSILSGDGNVAPLENSKPDVPPPAAPKPASPGTPPPATKVPIRLVATDAEITQMRSAYTSSCQGCHGQLPGAKAGRSAAQIGAATTVGAHRNLVSAMNWPRDVTDTTDDGVDQAKLLAGAMARVLAP